ncbi:MAG: hypothetical protein GY755_03430 [Chloroflexi bacterium]|nr:hypothetical protein [Chloroflexota bacterium]
MKQLLIINRKILLEGGGWFPITVFTLQLMLKDWLHIYDYYPSADVPMHFIGGIAIAFFVSRSFQLLPREAVKRSRIVLLELLLIGSLTATAAVFWEFAEFALDQFADSNIQVSLANTMKDLAMGILGAILLIVVRAKQLNIGKNELREITYEWLQGQAA